MSVRVKATAKYLRGSTRRAQLVVRAIKGKPVADAASILRFRPRAQGRAFAIHKPMTHITVVVSPKEA